MHKGMLEKTLEINYNLDYLVIVPACYEVLLESFAYSFGNVLPFNNTVEDVEFVTKFLRRNIVRRLTFVDYYGEYNEIINSLVEECPIDLIFTGGLGELSDPLWLQTFDWMCEKNSCGVAEKIGFLDPSLYDAMKKSSCEARYVKLDLPRVKNKTVGSSRMIGILGSDTSHYANFYNQLSSFAFLEGYVAKVLNPSKVSQEFALEYGITIEAVKTTNELTTGNVCNVKVDFAGSSVATFMKSMDMGVPCVVGNNSFLEEGSKLNEYLVVKSDDDVREIAEKIKGAIEKREKILEAYEPFRKKWSKESRALVEDFLGCEVRRETDKKYDKLLSVVVPVYNTEKYLEGCLRSVIEAAIPEMEILIINDGSTDGSEKIAQKFERDYPDMVRYIKQKNGGLGNVRNVGLREAQGKYLTSVDSDDSVEPETFKVALEFMKKDVDVIVYDWLSVGEEQSFETAAVDWVFKERREIDGILYTTIMPSTCNKIIKKEIFENEKIVYLEQKFEDLSANPLALIAAKTIKYINKPYYKYYLRDNSLMRSKINPRHMTDAIKFLNERLKTDRLKNAEEFKYYTYSWRIEEYILNPLYELKGKELSGEVKYIYDELYSLTRGVFENEYYQKMLEGLKSNELREFVKRRNAAFKKKELENFLKEVQEPQKLTAPIIYYGD